MRIVTDRLGIAALFVDETLASAEEPLYFHHRTVPPGGRAHAAHAHAADQVEGLFIIEGEAEIQIDDEVQRLQAGEAALINTRRLHGFRNAGATPLRYLVMTAPGPPHIAPDAAR
jgi:uncharacterized cupin superfamily protein